MKKTILMLALMSAFIQVGAKNYIRLIRNATLKMEYAGKLILVDPLLGAKSSMGSALGVNTNPRVNQTMPVEEIRMRSFSAPSLPGRSLAFRAISAIGNVSILVQMRSIPTRRRCMSCWTRYKATDCPTT